MADELSFTRAAARLNLSQPSLSQQIRRIETQLGVKIFERSKRFVAVTRQGEGFIGHARDVLDHYATGARLARQAALGQLGSLKICSVDPALVELVPRLVSRFLDHYPKIDVELMDASTSEQADLLRAGAIDIGFLNPPADLASLKTKILGRHSLVLVVPKGHALSYNLPVDPIEFSDQAFVDLPPDYAGGRGEMVRDLLTRFGPPPRIAQRTENTQTMLKLVAAKVGLAIVPEPISGMQNVALDFVPIKGDPSVPIAIAWQEEHHSAIVENFLALLEPASAPDMQDEDAS